MTEDRIDRRYHWIKEGLIALVFATGWLLRLEWSQKTEHDINAETHKDQKRAIKEMDATVDDLTHRIIVLETEQKCKGKAE